MCAHNDLPSLAFVRVLTSGGPYTAGQLLALAFLSPGVGRLLAHDTNDSAGATEPRPGELVPESISAVVTQGADPYEAGVVVTLSFVDPRVARIHQAPVAYRAATAPVSHPTERGDGTPAEQSEFPPAMSDTGPGAVRVRLLWTPQRVRRFVAVADKLLTVDRLGWYRHALAVRLLLPDEIATGDNQCDSNAKRCLDDLRAAAQETFGRPLLGALMPNFAVTPDWLDALDDPKLARSLSDLREILADRIDDDTTARPSAIDDRSSVGVIRRTDLFETTTSSIDATFAVLVPSFSAHTALTGTLVAYREALVELFVQTAQSVDTVRLTQMTQPNRVLDDRLWQLVSAVSTSFDGLAVA